MQELRGRHGDKALAAFKKAGEAPKEVLYQIKLQCASDTRANLPAADRRALRGWFASPTKTTYWNNLIRLERQDERDDHNTLMIYRVMYDTASMQADTDYIEMAQLLGDAALPGEAQMVLEKLMSTSGVLKDEHKERTTRLLNSLKTRADADKKGLPALDAEASKNAAGQLDVKLGEVYFGAGDYQGTVTAITRGIGKGQIKQMDEAYVYLGRAQAQLKNIADAKKAFTGLKSVPNVSPRVLSCGSCTQTNSARNRIKEANMTIKAGDKMPEGAFTRMTKDGPQKMTTEQLFAGKTVVLFSVPGAFTPTCDAKHLPGFVELADQIKAKGADTIARTAVNDVRFVMNAWGKHGGNVGDKILMLADGNVATYVKALGLEMDQKFGMGTRGQRFAIIAKNGVATKVDVEAPGEFKVSAAEHVLKQL